MEAASIDVSGQGGPAYRPFSAPPLTISTPSASIQPARSRKQQVGRAVRSKLHWDITLPKVYNNGQRSSVLNDKNQVPSQVATPYHYTGSGEDARGLRILIPQERHEGGRVVGYLFCGVDTPYPLVGLTEGVPSGHVTMGRMGKHVHPRAPRHHFCYGQSPVEFCTILHNIWFGLTIGKDSLGGGGIIGGPTLKAGLLQSALKTSCRYL